MIAGLVLSAVTTLGLAGPSLPLFFVEAVIAGAASGIYASPQQAAVADIIGEGQGGTAGGLPDDVRLRIHRRIVRRGVLAQKLSYGLGFRRQRCHPAGSRRSAGCWLRRPATRFRGAGGLAPRSGGPAVQ